MSKTKRYPVLIAVRMSAEDALWLRAREEGIGQWVRDRIAEARAASRGVYDDPGDRPRPPVLPAAGAVPAEYDIQDAELLWQMYGSLLQPPLRQDGSLNLD